VKDAICNRLGPMSGLLFVVLVMTGFLIHGYPDTRPSDTQLSKWIASVDVSRFSAGVYVEELGLLMFIPFVAWLYTRLREAGGAPSWMALVTLAAGTGWIVLTLPINEVWVGVLDQARRGLDIRVAQTLVSVNQAWFEMSSILLGLMFLAAGAAILRGRVMSRWAGWAAIVLGVTQLLPPSISQEGQLVATLWILVVAAYYSVRPTRTSNRLASTLNPAVGAELRSEAEPS
jgi:hypothetical protein